MARIEGLPELSKNLQSLIKKSGPQAEDGLLGIGNELRKMVHDRAPVGPDRRRRVNVSMSGISLGMDYKDVPGGNLKKSFRCKKFRKGKPGNPAVWVAPNRKIAPHAHLVEFGHGGPNPAPAHPYFRPALDAFRPGYLRKVELMIKDMIEGVRGIRPASAKEETAEGRVNRTVNARPTGKPKRPTTPRFTPKRGQGKLSVNQRRAKQRAARDEATAKGKRLTYRPGMFKDLI